MFQPIVRGRNACTLTQTSRSGYVRYSLELRGGEGVYVRSSPSNAEITRPCFSVIAIIEYSQSLLCATSLHLLKYIRFNNVAHQWISQRSVDKDEERSSREIALGATARGPRGAFGFRAVNVALHAITSASSILLFRGIFAGKPLPYTYLRKIVLECFPAEPAERKLGRGSSRAEMSQHIHAYCDFLVAGSCVTYSPPFIFLCRIHSCTSEYF